MENDKSRSFIARWRAAILSEYGPPKPSTKLVLAVLAEYANPDGSNCFPSVASICRQAGLSKRSVIEHIAEAKRLGWLDVNARGKNLDGWRRNAYRPLLPPALGADSAPIQSPNGEKSAPNTPPNGADSDTRLVQISASNGAESAHDLDQDLDHYQEGRAQRAKASPKKHRKAPFSDRPTELPASVAAETWAAFASHRKKIGKPLTDEAVRRLVPKLCRMADDGHDPGQALDNSIVNGWTGVFEPKPGESSVRPSQRRASPSDHASAGWD